MHCLIRKAAQIFRVNAHLGGWKLYLNSGGAISDYHKSFKYLDKKVSATIADLEQIGLIRIYTVCHSTALFGHITAVFNQSVPIV